MCKFIAQEGMNSESLSYCVIRHSGLGDCSCMQEVCSLNPLVVNEISNSYHLRNVAPLKSKT